MRRKPADIAALHARAAAAVGKIHQVVAPELSLVQFLRPDKPGVDYDKMTDEELDEIKRKGPRAWRYPLSPDGKRLPPDG